MSTATILTDAERDIRVRDLMSPRPPREREDRAKRMSISTVLTDAERGTCVRHTLSPSPSREPEYRANRMSTTTIIADAAGSSRSIDLQTRTPLNEWQGQVRLADAALGARRRDLLTRSTLRERGNQAERRTRACRRSRTPRFRDRAHARQ